MASEEDPVPELLDGVEMRVASGRWPAGTVGTVVDKLRDGALLVEVTDEGRTLETVVVHPSAVRQLATFEQERLAV
jgi:ribosomal protein L21E